ncbi:tetratricopeptide repeat protein [Erythrobacter sp. MTPC3]|uniref:tetratricopeptide repeat protein n=1 Tax=Erythrobacter sp. MTPC3 TaxID=3056564 RepID=UPI0036F302AF
MPKQSVYWRANAAALAVVGTAVMGVSPVAAETFRVEGLYGAEADIPADVEILAAEEFAGDWGYGLQASVTDVLTRPVPDFGVLYQVVPASLVQRDRVFIVESNTSDEAVQEAIEIPEEPFDAPDALLRGAAFGRIDDTATSAKKKSECIRRDDDGKCVAKRKFTVPCRILTVHYDGSVMIVAPDGQRLYERSDTLSNSQTYCQGESATPDPDTMLGGLASQFISRVSRDLMPRYVETDLRLLEQRKGLSKNDRRAFKAALKLTKNDPYGACLGFRALEQADPDHMSVLFNIGLCDESEHELDQAEAYYDRVLALEPGKSYPLAGLERIAARRAGMAQLRGRSALRADSFGGAGETLKQ